MCHGLSNSWIIWPTYVPGLNKMNTSLDKFWMNECRPAFFRSRVESFTCTAEHIGLPDIGHGRLYSIKACKRWILMDSIGEDLSKPTERPSTSRQHFGKLSLLLLTTSLCILFTYPFPILVALPSLISPFPNGILYKEIFGLLKVVYSFWVGLVIMFWTFDCLVARVYLYLYCPCSFWRSLLQLQVYPAEYGPYEASSPSEPLSSFNIATNPGVSSIRQQ